MKKALANSYLNNFLRRIFIGPLTTRLVAGKMLQFQ